MADQAISQRAEASGPTMLIEEVSADNVCRPQLFVLPELSGVAEATTVMLDGAAQGQWRLYLQWADGHREAMVLPSALGVPGRGSLLFAPQPTSPALGTVPGWSLGARKRWLDGQTSCPAHLFNQLLQKVNRLVVFAESEADTSAAVTVLWIMLTYCFPAWPAVPYLHITGTLASGKSRLMEVISRLAWRTTLASSLTASVLFRTLHERGGTILLDEAERLAENTAQTSELRTVFLAGYKTPGRVLRSARHNGCFHTLQFDVFGPKALAGIGDLPPALASRCIRVNLLRAAGDRPQLRQRLDDDDGSWQELRDDLHGFGLSRASEILHAARRTNPAADGLGGRDTELWKPLLDLAGLCQRAGAVGLVDSVRDFARQAAADNEETATPPPEKLLISLLAASVAMGSPDTTAKDLLAAAQREEPVTFARWTPHRVAATLRRYGLVTVKTSQGRRSYRDVTPQQLARIARVHGLSWTQPNATLATHATTCLLPLRSPRSATHPPSGQGGHGGIPASTPNTREPGQ